MHDNFYIVEFISDNIEKYLILQCKFMKTI